MAKDFPYKVEGEGYSYEAIYFEDPNIVRFSIIDKEFLSFSVDFCRDISFKIANVSTEEKEFRYYLDGNLEQSCKIKNYLPLCNFLIDVQKIIDSYEEF